MAPRIRKTKPKAASTAATTPATSTAPTPAVTTHLVAPATQPTTTPLVLLDLPPTDINIPQPPSNFVPGDTADYRAVLPRDAELRALPTAVKDIGKFTNYAQVLGDTAPPYAQMMQALIVANAWSTVRTESAAWDAFSGAQEGIAWTTLRALMARLQPSFDLAAKGGSAIATLYPGLDSLLVAKKVIARKGASTRKKNTQAEAKGEEPTHGAVGKSRKRAAEKAGYAAAGAASAASVPSVPAPVQQAAAPVVSPPAAQAVPVTAATGNAVPNGTNGVAHS